MYSLPDFRDGKLTQYDLPDEIFLEMGGKTFLVPRVEQFYYDSKSWFGNYALFDTPNPYPNPDPDYPFLNVVIGHEFGISDNWLVDVDFFDDTSSVSCFGIKRISVNSLTSYFLRIAVYDNFSSSYLVSGPVSGTVTRANKWTKTDSEYFEQFINYFNGGSIGRAPSFPQTVCRWSGNGVSLKWNPLTARWNVNGFEKSGFQNTPLGPYGPYTVS